jgi:hypothetical protein
MPIIEELRCVVLRFSNAWFPETGPNPKFWFRARDPKYRSEIHSLCEKNFHAIQTCIDNESPSDIISKALDLGWSTNELVILAVLFDQMPRNALAIGFGPFAGKDPLNVHENVDDSFSLDFAQRVLDIADLGTLSDERQVCFFSLVFRHSADCDTAKKVLNNLRDSEGNLPPLAAKFWTETEKRQSSNS